jgi:hypothetical protein
MEMHGNMQFIPRFDPSVTPGGKILVFGEQGIGDQVLFASCLPDLVEAGNEITLAVDSKLVDLFADSFPQIQVFSMKDNAIQTDTFDCVVPIGSLPMYFRNDADDFPRENVFLKTSNANDEYWRKQLENLSSNIKIGIAWQGGLNRTRSYMRSLKLSEFRPLLTVPGVDFISLQYTDCQDEIAEFEQDSGIKIHHWQAAIDDYAQTAALVGSLDMIISVCTSVVTLAGALGKTAWVLVPASPGWMFGLDGEQSDWFSSLRLYRQQRDQAWSGVIEQVARDLAELV